ncbi:hypothetical protein [Xanthocytophaga agilis]|uniref:Uncharacterized protein n=1 Tax=Xanthocytophaga agilis TaxID=3048010 RepID=A0AAE3R139_9BACT|nr:hypothetical protein [Xanthocytophaga agilis]MDJ1501806.1 hypothetical protein [Xanthocytophaga agilis]
MNFFKKLFSSSEPSINSLKIDTTEWVEEEKTDKEYKWERKDYPAILSINFFSIPPDLPCHPDHIDNLRNLYRTIAQPDGGIIEVTNILIAGIPSVKTIFKFPMQPTGMAYIGSITIPFKNYSYVVKIQSWEQGTTGVRDATIANKMLSEGTIELGENGITGWFKDPYDSEIREGIQMNLSESEEYDSMFPQHPLTFVRTGLKKIERSICIEKELLQTERFQ